MGLAIDRVQSTLHKFLGDRQDSQDFRFGYRTNTTLSTFLYTNVKGDPDIYFQKVKILGNNVTKVNFSVNNIEIKYYRVLRGNFTT
ncbi:hypothetical protein C7B77_10610 [Chamaesiphon polymorphus CCALA 037]|uniref:Uncharacterized protein n=1 Tax=Chamaesiphon polymorphus CCALA 037 TaxID=2107692 RepID=A0A2T1GGL0_9CYAN|nr:hypothetical protein C7B77_10610 [Chamaesiphon polymorphus CCALA 037]